LTYFDPIATKYKVAQTGPYKLTFGNLETTTMQGTNSEQVIVIDTTQPLTRPIDGATFSDVAVRMRNLRRSLPLAVALVLAVIIFNFMWRTRRWVAVLAALVILILGLAEQRYLSKAQDEQIWQVVKNVSAKLCPSENALTIFDLSVGQNVTITETTAEWIRLNATGREGWVPRDCVIRP
jgi:hypothetical protein